MSLWCFSDVSGMSPSPNEQKKRKWKQVILYSSIRSNWYHMVSESDRIDTAGRQGKSKRKRTLNPYTYIEIESWNIKVNAPVFWSFIPRQMKHWLNGNRRRNNQAAIIVWLVVAYLLLLPSFKVSYADREETASSLFYTRVPARVVVSRHVAAAA